MRREQFDHLLRAASAIVGDDRLTVIGSQAILGSFDDSELPAVLVLSQEVDLIPLGDSQGKRDLIDGTIGEFSQFHETFGLWAHGVAEATGVLPAGWRDRLVSYSSARTPGVVALCLEVHDLWVAKAMRSDPRDVAYCQALAGWGRLSPSVIADRLAATPAAPERLALARSLAGTSFGTTQPWSPDY